jgi:hypothetical protein
MVILKITSILRRHERDMSVSSSTTQIVDRYTVAIIKLILIHPKKKKKITKRCYYKKCGEQLVWAGKYNCHPIQNETLVICVEKQKTKKKDCYLTQSKEAILSHSKISKRKYIKY